MPAHKGPRRGAYRPVSETAAEVRSGLSADASLSPHAKGEEVGDMDAEVRRIRAMRKPFGALQQKLALPKRDGYHRHWFNDSPGRVDEAKNSGWVHVKDEEGRPIKRVVGSGRDNGALVAYAMELPQVFWDEDQAAMNQAAADKMAALKASPFRSAAGQSKPSDSGKFYSPQEAEPIQITNR